MDIQQAMRTRFDSPDWPAARQAYIDHHSTEPMRFTGPKHWGNILTVGPLRTVTGRLLIGVETESGRSYAITISRWIGERRAGRILPIQTGQPAHTHLTVNRGGAECGRANVRLSENPHEVDCPECQRIVLDRDCIIES